MQTELDENTVSASDGGKKKPCARAECTNTISIIPGHRPRQYCSDRCKQLAYLQREEEKQQETRAAAMKAQHERDVLGLQERYGPETLPLGTIEALIQFSAIYGAVVTVVNRAKLLRIFG